MVKQAEDQSQIIKGSLTPLLTPLLAKIWEGVSLVLCTNVGEVFTETQICGLKLDLMTNYPILLRIIAQTQVD